MRTFALASPLSIMYVEDDPVTRDLVAQTLPKRFPRWTVHTAENGRAGLELYRRHRPDIVITDVNMPLMNGILMAGEIRGINPDVVIIAVTAYSETNYLLNAIEIGISHYVLKPIDYRRLFEAIERSSAGVVLKQQYDEQRQLISDLNESLEQKALELSARGEEQRMLARTLAGDIRSGAAGLCKGMAGLLKDARSRLTEAEQARLAALCEEAKRLERLGKCLEKGRAPG